MNDIINISVNVTPPVLRILNTFHSNKLIKSTLKWKRGRLKKGEEIACSCSQFSWVGKAKKKKGREERGNRTCLSLRSPVLAPIEYAVWAQFDSVTWFMASSGPDFDRTGEEMKGTLSCWDSVSLLKMRAAQSNALRSTCSLVDLCKNCVIWRLFKSCFAFSKRELIPQLSSLDALSLYLSSLCFASILKRATFSLFLAAPNQWNQTSLKTKSTGWYFKCDCWSYEGGACDAKLLYFCSPPVVKEA